MEGKKIEKVKEANMNVFELVVLEPLELVAAAEKRQIKKESKCDNNLANNNPVFIDQGKNRCVSSMQVPFRIRTQRNGRLHGTSIRQLVVQTSEQSTHT